MGQRDPVKYGNKDNTLGCPTFNLGRIAPIKSLTGLSDRASQCPGKDRQGEERSGNPRRNSQNSPNFRQGEKRFFASS
jgi:hypothetical protein